jgi:hypothetical protein
MQKLYYNVDARHVHLLKHALLAGKRRGCNPVISLLHMPPCQDIPMHQLPHTIAAAHSAGLTSWQHSVQSPLDSTAQQCVIWLGLSGTHGTLVCPRF